MPMAPQSRVGRRRVGTVSPTPRQRVVLKDPQASRITNGSALLPGNVDGRSTWVRRCKDLIALHTTDLGGPENISVAELSLIRRAAALTVELEMMEASWAEAGQATPAQLDLYSRTAGNLRRLLETLGLKRRAKDVTPDDPLEYAAREHAT